MRVLIVDNYDSFTFNIFQEVARVTGVAPVVVRNDQLTLGELLALEPDAVILSPGPGRPDHASDFGLCGGILAAHRFPILGICLGHQGIAHAFGGSVRAAPEPRHGRRSAVFHDGSALFDGIPQAFQAVRYHSLCVASPLPPVLERIAWCDDGLVMALRHREHPIWGVQFHPESIGSDHGGQLIENFVELARGARLDKGGDARRSWTPAERRLSVVPRKDLEADERKPDHELRFVALEGPWDTETVFTSLFADEPTAFWLDSSRRDGGEARFSFMGGPMGPHGERLTYSAATKKLRITRRGETITVETMLWTYLDERLRDQRTARPGELPFDFTCGYVGYLGYELASDGPVERTHRSKNADADLLLADRMLAFDHETGMLYLLALSSLDDVGRARTTAWFDETSARLRSLRPLAPAREGSGGALPPAPFWSRDRRRYERDIDEALRQIQEGETYEVCLTNHIRAKSAVDPLQFYRHLRAANPAPYAAFLRFDGLAVASSSPERFLKLDRHRRVETKPVKGTAPRGATIETDRSLAETLRTSEKTRSENMMITDLLRNDLGLVCEVGSVEVPRLMHVESYATVHQLVTTIRGTLRPEMSAVDCVRASFPGGSMTGAPKVRTMQLIDRLETEARGIYSGAIGFFSLNGTADLNIVIRTAVFDRGEVDIGVGGAVVALSRVEEEFDEIMLKARALLRALIVTTCGHDGSDERLAEVERRLRE